MILVSPRLYVLEGSTDPTKLVSANSLGTAATTAQVVSLLVRLMRALTNALLYKPDVRPPSPVKQQQEAGDRGGQRGIGIR